MRRSSVWDFLEIIFHFPYFILNSRIFTLDLVYGLFMVHDYCLDFVHEIFKIGEFDFKLNDFVVVIFHFFQLLGVTGIQYV